MPEDDYNPYGEISFVIAHLGMLSESKKVEAYDMAQQVAKGMLSWPSRSGGSREKGMLS